MHRHRENLWIATSIANFVHQQSTTKNICLASHWIDRFSIFYHADKPYLHISILIIDRRKTNFNLIRIACAKRTWINAVASKKCRNKKRAAVVSWNVHGMKTVERVFTSYLTRTLPNSTLIRPHLLSTKCLHSIEALPFNSVVFNMIFEPKFLTIYGTLAQ